ELDGRDAPGCALREPRVGDAEAHLDRDRALARCRVRVARRIAVLAGHALAAPEAGVELGEAVALARPAAGRARALRAVRIAARAWATAPLTDRADAMVVVVDDQQVPGRCHEHAQRRQQTRQRGRALVAAVARRAAAGDRVDDAVRAHAAN